VQLTGGIVIVVPGGTGMKASLSVITIIETLSGLQGQAKGL
jgi:hypothetical protein